MRQWCREVIRQVGLLGLLVALGIGIVSLDSAQAEQFGPFTNDASLPGTIFLNGAIDAGSGLAFRRALSATPAAKLVVLSSPGGLVDIALLIADDIYERGLSTFIPSGAECHSACAFIFLAGRERVAAGSLGVHQISSEKPDLQDAQRAIADIMDVLDRFDVPLAVRMRMLKTPPDEMYVFTSQELQDLGINRTGGADSVARHVPERPSPAPMRAQNERVALYVGLDFYGGDLTSIKTADAAACAARCLGAGSLCRAFTFNVDDKLVRGPNCFLKSGGDVADGNVLAISGLFLTGADGDPQPRTLGVIDPKQGLLKDIDLQGGDLSGRPHPGALTTQQCRISCVQYTSCQAFTFVKSVKQCWLKGAGYRVARKGGMVSGQKVSRTFAPSDIIQLSR